MTGFGAAIETLIDERVAAVLATHNCACRCSVQAATAPPRTAWKVLEVAESIGLSESKVYQLCESGELRSFRIGTRVLVPVEALAELIERAVQSPPRVAGRRIAS